MEVTYLNLPWGRVDHQTVFACEDADLLLSWHRGAYNIHDDVVAQLEVQTLADTAGTHWRRKAAGKIAVCGMVMRWIERRLVELGHDQPMTRKRNAQSQLERLQAQIAWLQAQLAEAKGGL